MVVSSCRCYEMRKKYWIQQIKLRLQTVEQLWPSSIYVLDTRWWSRNGHLLQNENYHKKTKKKEIMLCFNSELFSIISMEDVALGNSFYTIYSSFSATKIYKNLEELWKKKRILYVSDTWVKIWMQNITPWQRLQKNP